MFQSLTGSIHTWIGDLRNVEMTPFQSLTGSIHTNTKKQNRRFNNKVSIPHRFNSHFYTVTLPFLQFLRFNPSQVQFTQNLEKESFLLKRSFNPSQVQFTLNFNFCLLLQVNVSIPHRFNSHNGNRYSIL